MKPIWLIEDFTGRKSTLGIHMKPKWLIENFTGDNGYEELIAEVRRQGFTCHVLDITNHFDLKPNLIEPNDCVVFQGSIQLFRKLKEELPAFPIGWMTEEAYQCSYYYGYFQKYLFNDNFVLTTVAALKQRCWWFYGNFGKEALIYVRPNDGGKSFTGQLLDMKDFHRFWEDGTRNGSKDSDLVVVSTPKKICGEWRFICTNKKEILGKSLYKYQDQRTYVPSAPLEATQLVEEILDVGYYPDPVFTVDIVEDGDGKYWLMELNSFTSAGTYAAEKEPIVRRVSEIAEEEWKKVKEANA